VQVVKLLQSAAPLWEALCSYKDKGVLPFHTPGHKLRGDLFPRLIEELGPGVFQLDPSDEVEDITINHDFHRALEAAQQLAAQLFGAAYTLFLVNGTTSGLHYLLHFMEGAVAIPRFSHQAVYTGAMLSGSECLYIPAQFDPEWQIPLPPTVEALRRVALGQSLSAAVFTHPTYYGTCAQLEELIAEVHRLGAYAFVDEAHGGHFRFSLNLPSTGLEAQADGVVQSTHKNLGSLTQTSMLHSASGEVYDLASRARQILETTSPSLVFLAVLDEVRRTLHERGQELVSNALELARSVSARLESVPGVLVLPDHLRHDPTKVVFSLRELGLTGIQLEGLLRRDYNIQVELSDYYNVIALITLGDTEERVNRLCSAVEDLARRARHLGGPPLPVHQVSYPPLPKQALGMRDAVRRQWEAVPLKAAQGRVSAAFVTPYPPGVPLLVPGEVVSREVVEYLQWCLGLGWPIRGLDGLTVSVIKDNAVC
jgi:lysine decarboxylase